MSAPTATRAQRAFDEEFTARNFNSSPLTISGLRGDLYDYYPALEFDNATVNTDVLLRANSDGTANYRTHVIKGAGSTDSASVNDSDSSVSLDDSIRTSGPSLSLCAIAGESGEERGFTGLLGAGGERVVKVSGNWKNTADEMTSLTISFAASSVANAHIVLFAVPKDSAQEEWELIDKNTWTSELTTKTFIGINGDVDGQYLVKWSGDQDFNIAPNGDSSTVYINEDLRNQGGSLVGSNSTGQTSFVITGHESKIVINAISGQQRVASSSASKTSSAQQSERSHWYDNTGDNITSLACSPAVSGSGTAYLYRKRTLVKASDVLPWEIIKEVPVSGDFSSGYTFTDLEGDKEFLYKVEAIGSSGATTRLRAIINGDAGSSYDMQNLRATNSTTDAQDITRTYMWDDFTPSEQGSLECIIYPKAGQSRPVLSTRNDTSRTRKAFVGELWTNTGDEINSIHVFTNTTASSSLTLRLSKIPRVQP